MSINLLSSYGIRIDEQREYHSELLNDDVLLIGDSVYTVNNPKNLPVYTTTDLETVRAFKKRGGDAQELHVWKKLWPEAKLSLQHHEIHFWDHSKLPVTATVSPKKNAAIELVFRSQESLSDASMKIVESTKRARRTR